MTRFTRVKLFEDMIDLFGGLRFRRMDLCRVHRMQHTVLAPPPGNRVSDVETW